MDRRLVGRLCVTTYILIGLYISSILVSGILAVLWALVMKQHIVEMIYHGLLLRIVGYGLVATAVALVVAFPVWMALTYNRGDWPWLNCGVLGLSIGVTLAHVGLLVFVVIECRENTRTMIRQSFEELIEAWERPEVKLFCGDGDCADAVDEFMRRGVVAPWWCAALLGGVDACLLIAAFCVFVIFAVAPLPGGDTLARDASLASLSGFT